MIVCLSASDLMNVYINNVPFKSRDDIKTSFFFFFYGKRKMSADQKVKKKTRIGRIQCLVRLQRHVNFKANSGLSQPGSYFSSFGHRVSQL